MTHASSGPARVLATGTVTTFDGFPLVLGIDHPLALELELRFLSDPAVPDVALRDVGQVGPRICWELVNFDGPDGRGSAAPALVADTGEVKIYLHFRVFLYGRTRDRTVHYTFYQVAGPAPTRAG